MKVSHYLSVLLVFVLASCSSVNVYNDYDKKVDFTPFKTFAFYKAGVDQVEISDLDKKRILRAIETEMLAKGFTKSENPDVLVNFFTKSRVQVDLTTFNNYWGYGYGWNPYMSGRNRTSVRTTNNGTLFIDLIDAKKKEMIWQGEGEGEIFKNQDKKEERIQEFVTEILKQYPPEKK